MTTTTKDVYNTYSGVNRATLARNVELCMTDVLIQLIEDVGLLGPELTELILEQFDKFEKVKVHGLSTAYHDIDIFYRDPSTQLI